MTMSEKIIYPGTFDPITNGHLDLITRASLIFSDLIVAVASSTTKKPFFSLQERIGFIEDAVAHLPSVRVIGCEGLLLHCVQQQGARMILRGLRAVSDFEYEFQLAGMNRQLSNDIETLFLMPSDEVMFISSSLVREISCLGGDVTAFVPALVARGLQEKKINI